MWPPRGDRWAQALGRAFWELGLGGGQWVRHLFYTMLAVDCDKQGDGPIIYWEGGRCKSSTAGCDKRIQGFIIRLLQWEFEVKDRRVHPLISEW